MGLLKDIFAPNPLPVAPEMPVINTVMTANNIVDIRAGRIYTIPVKKLILKRDESCMFCDYAVQISEKLLTVARHGNGFGASFRICRGLTWHTGTHDMQHIRDKVPEYTKGKLYITDRRIIFSSDSKAFQRNISSLISYRIEDGCLILQFPNASYKLYLPVPDCAEKVIESIV